MLLALQWASGAWEAEFDGHPDEAAHYVTGRMVQTYIARLPRQNPIAWVKQYYLHYPKVAMGHWPPGFHLTEALWWSAFGPSRISTMLLQCLLGVVSLVLFYKLIRPRFPVPVVAGLMAAAVATPVFQQSLERTMVEMACLVCSLCLMHAYLRKSFPLMALALLAGAAMKGNAICLIPIPFFALNKRPDWRIVAGLAVAAGGTWIVLGKSIKYWAGITDVMPWPWPTAVEMTGWGIVAVAALGVTRDPLSRLSALMVASAVSISFGVRAMNESRHWNVILPAVLILVGFAVTRFPMWIGAALAVAALALFPWMWYHQKPTGARELVTQLPRPARMMVSSYRHANGEGSWIAEANMAEEYPGSFVTRASRILARSGWNNEKYQLLVQTPAEVQRRLDELAIEIVVTDERRARGDSHNALVLSTMEAGTGWRKCAHSGKWEAWCRTTPPAVPRIPLVMEAGGWRMVEEF